MLELLVNGEIRGSTMLKLLAQYWEVIGITLLVTSVLLVKISNRIKTKLFGNKS